MKKPIIRQTLSGAFNVSILDPSNPPHRAGDFPPREIVLNIFKAEKEADDYAAFFSLVNQRAQ